METVQLRPWIGPVNDEKYFNFLNELAKNDPEAPFQLMISSQGGVIARAFSFFDAISVGGYDLTTIGSGQISGAAIIVWLAGRKRLLSEHTLLCFNEIHSDVCDVGKEFSGTQAKMSLNEKNQSFFIEIVASGSKEKLDAEKIRTFMKDEVILEPQEAVEFGLAHGIS